MARQIVRAEILAFHSRPRESAQNSTIRTRSALRHFSNSISNTVETGSTTHHGESIIIGGEFEKSLCERLRKYGNVDFIQ
jgi:hypothetical protein